MAECELFQADFDSLSALKGIDRILAEESLKFEETKTYGSERLSSQQEQAI